MITLTNNLNMIIYRKIISLTRKFRTLADMLNRATVNLIVD